MRALVVRLMLSCICLQLAIGPAAFADQLDLPADKRPSVFANRRIACVAFAKGDQKDDGVGLPFLEGNTPEAFEAQLKDTIAKRGLEWFNRGTFFVSGVGMRDANRKREAFQQILNRNGLSAKQVRIISVPDRLLGDLSVGLAEHLFQRFRYFWPNKERHYQIPTREEIQANLYAMGVIEGFGVAYVFTTMPVHQAMILKTISLSILSAYGVLQKSMINWLMDDASSNELNKKAEQALAAMGVNVPAGLTLEQNAEVFAKQYFLSLPFLTNYAIIGNMQAIQEYYNVYGWNAIRDAFPGELAKFVASVGSLLTIMQTAFYSLVVVGKTGTWVDRQIGDQNQKDARTLLPWLRIPILAPDVVLLLIATSHTATNVYAKGSLEINVGHVGLFALIIGSLYALTKYPYTLDAALEAFQAFKQRRAERREAREQARTEKNAGTPPASGNSDR